MKSDEAVDKKKKKDPQGGKKSNGVFIVVGLIVIVGLASLLVCGGKQCPLNIFNRNSKISFKALQGGIQFKTPSGSNVTLSVVSSDVITVKSVKRDGKDTIVRLSPAIKK